MTDERNKKDARPSAFARGSREALSDLLALHVELAEAGGGVAVLTGPRGVGKGTLLAETRREMSSKGRMVLFGRAEQSATRPYAPFCEPAGQALAQLESRGVAEDFLDRHARALGVLLPGLAAPASGQARDKTAFFEALRAFFLDLARQGPITLLLSDVHYADSDTRDLVRFLAAHLFDADAVGRSGAKAFGGVMLLATRDDDDDGSAFVRSLLEGTKAKRFDVTGLSREDLLAYLQNHPGLDRLLAASRGRPEDVDELFEALPKDTDALLLEKVDALGEQTQAVLRALSVVGRPAPPDLVADGVGLTGAEVAQQMAALVELRLLKRRLQNGELLFSFSRPHQEEVIFQNTSDVDKRKFHNAIGATLENRTHGVDDDTTLAHHFLRGSDPKRGIPYAIAACERLIVTFAYGAAADLAEQALDVADDDDTRFALLGHITEARRLRGDLGLALDAAQRMRDVAPNDQLPQVLRRIGELSAARGERKQARAALESALARLDDGDASTGSDTVGEALPERALILATMADVDYGSHAFDQANKTCDAALAAAPNAPMAFRLRVFNTVAKLHYSREQFVEAEERFLENLRLAEAEGLEHEAMLARINTGLARYRRGEYEDARDILDRALTAARASGDIYNEAHALLNLGVISQRLSDLARSVKHLKNSLALFSRLGIRSEIRRTTWNLANVYTAIGAHDEARVHLEQSRRLADSDDSHRGRAFVQFTEGDLAFDQGQFAGALAAYERARAIFDKLGESSRVVEMTVKIAWAALMLQDVSTAEKSLETLSEPPAQTLAAARQEAVQGATIALAAEQRGGQQGAAVDGLSALLRAIDAFELHLAQEDAWRALLFLADRYEARGDERSAAAARDRAKAIVEALATRLPEPLRANYLNDPVRSTLVGAPVTAPVDDSPVEISGVMRPAPGPPLIPALPLQPAERTAQWDEKYPELVGSAPTLLRVFDRLDRVTRSQGATVLIRGESGTGKELVAAAVHRHGDRKPGPFIRVNCAALVETLLLSELFGHEKGSFTGAFARKIGRFELARGGTIFLDEIGDISAKTQVSLLRVLQEKSFERVGGTQTITTDAAVICATHRDLERMVADGTFREDLYYRMRGLVIEVPALRDRAADIPPLASHFLSLARKDLGRAPTSFSADAYRVLQNYGWPGNIRELQNVIRSVALFCEGDVVEPTHLAEFPELFEARKERRPSIPMRDPDVTAPPPPKRVALPPVVETVRPTLPAAPTSHDVLRRVEEEARSGGLALGDLKRRLEFEAIANAMRQTSGNITKAAALLKMKRPRLSQIVNGNPALKEIKEESRRTRQIP